MTQDQIVRAWKNPAYRAGLSATQLRAIPANPAGAVELSESELMETSGGSTPTCYLVISLIVGVLIDG